MTNDIEVFYEATPNPQSMKYTLTATLAKESVNFENLEEATRSPLAQKIFGFPWTAGVHIGPNTVTVTKQDWVDCKVLADPLCDLIKEHLQNGESLLNDNIEADVSSEKVTSDDPLTQKILDFLDQEVRPAVAMDGGDIIFQKFHEGTLFVKMLGACNGCPSSTITLKQGIEARIQTVIPEVKEVVAV